MYNNASPLVEKSVILPFTVSLKVNIVCGFPLLIINRNYTDFTEPQSIVPLKHNLRPTLYVDKELFR